MDVVEYQQINLLAAEISRVENLEEIKLATARCPA